MIKNNIIDDCLVCPGYLVKKISYLSVDSESKINEIKVKFKTYDSYVYHNSKTYSYEYDNIELYESTYKKWFKLSEIENIHTMFYLVMHNFTHVRMKMK